MSVVTVVRSVCLLALAVPLISHASIERFVVMSNNERLGALTVTLEGNDVEVDYGFSANGRGPASHEKIRLDAHQRPLQWTIDGNGGIGAPVRENYSWHNGIARWRTLSDSGRVSNKEAPLYVAADASPWSYGLYLRALLKTPNNVISILPSGALRADKIRDLRFGTQPDAPALSAYALWGLRTAPLLVILRSDGSFFGFVDPGYIVILPEEYEKQFSYLSDLSVQLQQDYLEQLTARLMHRFDAPLYIRNVRIFDARAAHVGEPETIVVFRDRIASIRPDNEVPVGSDFIDGEGSVVLPGLTDAHTHLTSWSLPLQLAGGVTSTRDLGNDNEMLLRLVADIDSSKVMGPRVVLAGLLEGRSPFSVRMGDVADTLSAALSDVRWYAEHGHSSIKIYNSMTPDWVRPIAAEAHRLGLRVSGHVPAFMTSERAVLDGYDEINHINQLMLSFLIGADEDTRTPFRFTAMGARMAGLDLNGESVHRMIRLMQERHTTLDPTMALFEQLMLSEAGQGSPGVEAWLSHMPGPVQRANRKALLAVTAEQQKTYRASWHKMLETLKLLHDAGIRIVPGTDHRPGSGFMLHTELQIYEQAGISRERVLQIATLECARYFGREQDLGTVERGKLADFILVGGDPTRDLGALRNVRMVVKNGNVFFPEEIYALMNIEPFGRKLRAP